MTFKKILSVAFYIFLINILKSLVVLAEIMPMGNVNRIVLKKIYIWSANLLLPPSLLWIGGF